VGSGVSCPGSTPWYQNRRGLGCNHHWEVKGHFPPGPGAHCSVLFFFPGPRSRDKLVFRAYLGILLSIISPGHWPASWGNSTSVTLYLWSLTLQHPSWGETYYFTLQSKFYFPLGILLYPPYWKTSISHSLEWQYNCQYNKNCSSCTNKAKRLPSVLSSKAISPKAWRTTGYIGHY
jgi:hypothetical protein